MKCSMRKFLFAISVSTTIVSGSNFAQAVTLQEALTSGYDHDEERKIIQTEFLNEIEQFPQAVSEFMPKVRGVVENQRESISNRSALNTIAIRDNISRKSERYSKSIIVDQSVFSGGSSLAKLKAAQSSFRASRAAYYNREQEWLLNQINNYLGTVEAKEKYEISKTSVKSNMKQLEASREKFRLGESTDTEVASAEAGLAAAESNQSLARANYEAAMANFKRVFGIEPDDISMSIVPGDMPESLDSLIERALTANLSIQTARNSTKANQAREYTAKGALLPQVNFSFQSSRDEFRPEKLETSQMNRKGITSTVSVTVPILQRGGAEYSDIRRAKYESRKSAAQLGNEQKKIIANCRAEWESYFASKDRIEAADKGVRAAQVAYDGMIEEEKLGSKTIVDVLNMEERLNKARETKVEADKAMIISAYRIKALTGEVTAKSLDLPVEYFEPEKEFQNIKRKIIGF